MFFNIRNDLAFFCKYYNKYTFTDFQFDTESRNKPQVTTVAY